MGRAFHPDPRKDLIILPVRTSTGVGTLSAVLLFRSELVQGWWRVSLSPLASS